MIELIGAVALFAASAEPAKTDTDPVICKGSRTSRSIGSNLSRSRECKLKSEWEAIEKQTQRDIRKMRDRHVSPGGALGR